MVSGENNAHTAHLGAETPRSQGLREALEQSERGAGMASPLTHERARSRTCEWLDTIRKWTSSQLSSPPTQFKVSLLGLTQLWMCLVS